MNPKLPRPTARELIGALERADFCVVHVRGSHHVLRHPDGRRTVIPVHSGETIGVGLLSAILRQARISSDELRELL